MSITEINPVWSAWGTFNEFDDEPTIWIMLENYHVLNTGAAQAILSIDEAKDIVKELQEVIDEAEGRKDAELRYRLT